MYIHSSYFVPVACYFLDLNHFSKIASRFNLGTFDKVPVKRKTVGISD